MKNNKENELIKKKDLKILSNHRRTYSDHKEEIINNFKKKIDKISQGIINYTATNTSRLIKKGNKNPSKNINCNNINSSNKEDLGLSLVDLNKKNINNNKIIQSVKDCMREKYIKRKKKNNLNYNQNNINKLE